MCDHEWIANSGQGGEPKFRANRQMWFGLRMHVICRKCRARTWVTEEEWNDAQVRDQQPE